MPTDRPPPTAAAYTLSPPIVGLLAELGGTVTALARGENVEPADVGRLLLDLEELNTAGELVAGGLAADPHLCDPAAWAVCAALWGGVEGELSGTEWDALVNHWRTDT